jgi:hypothetical protein
LRSADVERLRRDLDPRDIAAMEDVLAPVLRRYGYL